ncbi:hypothetical protein PVW51_10805 [Sulfitobacter sp. PR48]|uniref:hypothetical protein n=1 Tax=Sulfitobacter sp. PR48 TaxID=3028383 RepID=UPI00237ABB44|nr:hypothetical protein [Sulfitobacter sp. PR48]MDD9721189.1 hypothetical protein [Sulfitobacter sp. PR48]
MKRSLSRSLLSLQSRRVVWTAVLLCVANYLLHLMPISLMGVFNWQVDTLRDQYPNPRSVPFEQAIAWMEFFAFSLLILAFAEILALVVVIREGVRMCIEGRSGLIVHAAGYLLIFVGPLLAAALPLMIFFGGSAAEALGAKVGIQMAMFTTFFLTAAAAAFNIGYLLEPETMQAS